MNNGSVHKCSPNGHHCSLMWHYSLDNTNVFVKFETLSKHWNSWKLNFHCSFWSTALQCRHRRRKFILVFAISISNFGEVHVFFGELFWTSQWMLHNSDFVFLWTQCAFSQSSWKMIFQIIAICSHHHCYIHLSSFFPCELVAALTPMISMMHAHCRISSKSAHQLAS